MRAEIREHWEEFIGKQVAEELPDVYEQLGEMEFPKQQIDDFRRHPVWREIEGRLLDRMSELFNSWMFCEDEKQNELKGQAQELVYFLKVIFIQLTAIEHKEENENA